MLRHLRDRRLLGGFALAFCLFFAFIAVFTYLPYRLAAPPFRLSTDAIASAYLVYVVGIAASPLAGRLAARVAPERIMLAGLAISAAGVAVTLSGSLAVLVTGLLVLVVGMFTAQALGPSYVNETATEAKGGASALYLAFYYLGGTLGSWLPGLAWQRWGWAGVAGSSLLALGAAALAVSILCRPGGGPSRGSGSLTLPPDVGVARGVEPARLDAESRRRSSRTPATMAGTERRIVAGEERFRARGSSGMAPQRITSDGPAARKLHGEERLAEPGSWRLIEGLGPALRGSRPGG